MFASTFSGNVRITMEEMLIHLSDCPGGGEDTRLAARNLFLVMQKLLSEEFLEEYAATSEELDVGEVFKSIDMYTVKKESVYEMLQEREITVDNYRSLVELVKRVFVNLEEGMRDRNAFMTALQKELPEYYQTVTAFEEWMGLDSLGKSQFDELISMAIRNILVSRGLSLELLNRAIEESLWVLKLAPEASKKDEPFDGVYFGKYRPDGAVRLRNEHLNAVLPILVLIDLRAKYDTASFSSQLSVVYKDLEAWYEDKIVQLSKAISRVHDSMVDATFVTLIENIDHIEIRELLRVATSEDYHDNTKLDREDRIFFVFLFNAVFLKRSGEVSDLQSSVFLAFLRVLFPDRVEQITEFGELYL